MLHRSYHPGPPLSEFVEDFWLYDDYWPGHFKERILPSGTTELVVNLRDEELRIYDRVRPGVCERFPGAVVSGTYGRSFVIDTAEEASMIGVHFKPGGAFPFFGLPASELVDAHVGLDALWDRPGRQLREQLLAAPGATDKLRILEAALVARLSASSWRPRHGAVRLAVDAFSRSSPTPTTVREITERVGLSHRRFNELFKTEVGLTPKLFHRVQRFQRTVALVRDVTEADWSRLALDCGFFDQSHLIRDFVEFSGFGPAAYARHLQALERRSVHLKRNHLPLAG